MAVTSFSQPITFQFHNCLHQRLALKLEKFESLTTGKLIVKMVRVDANYLLEELDFYDKYKTVIA